jgi:hypothetical protein
MGFQKATSEDYACTRCGAFTPRDDITVKKVVFTTMGSRGNVFRTRAVDWLCETCLGKDKQYNAPKLVSRADRLNVARSKRQASSS